MQATARFHGDFGADASQVIVVILQRCAEVLRDDRLVARNGLQVTLFMYIAEAMEIAAIEYAPGSATANPAMYAALTTFSETLYRTSERNDFQPPLISNFINAIIGAGGVMYLSQVIHNTIQAGGSPVEQASMLMGFMADASAGSSNATLGWTGTQQALPAPHSHMLAGPSTSANHHQVRVHSWRYPCDRTYSNAGRMC